MPSSEAFAEALRSIFEVIEVASVAQARERASVDDGSGVPEVVLLPASSVADADPESTEAGSPIRGIPAGRLLSTLEHIGEGVGVVDADGTLTWANARLRSHDAPTQQKFIETCREALDHFDQQGEAAVPLYARPSRRFTFSVEDAHYDAMVSIASIEDEADRRVRTVVGILWEVTAARKLQGKIDALDAAGAELMRIDASSIAKLNMAERLTLLEDKIISSVRELLAFDKFEVRLIDRESNQLELVFNRGLTPLRIGEVIYAEREDNGISGYVAATGECYLCGDVQRDPRYVEGLPEAASSLTVPLQLYDKVIGVFNVESATGNAFDENDRRFAQIFARYIAMAMHILDLMVIERYTTNEQVAANVLSELDEPLDLIAAETARLMEQATDPEAGTAAGIDRIIAAVEGIRRRLAGCGAGPRSILGAEQHMSRAEIDPRMAGKRIVLADNEPGVRAAIAGLLRSKGCDVTECGGGAETIDLLRTAAAEHRYFDLVISDIRMPGRNGYEVFRTVKEVSAHTPVILITGFGYDPHHSIVRARQEGLHSFLFKPLKASQLLEEVAKSFGARGAPRTDHEQTWRRGVRDRCVAGE